MVEQPEKREGNALADGQGRASRKAAARVEETEEGVTPT